MLYTIHDYEDQYTLEKNKNISLETLYERLSKATCWYNYISMPQVSFSKMRTADFIDYYNLDKTKISLFHIHKESQTEEICLAAVKRHGDELSYVVDQNPEICLAAVRSKDDSWDALYFAKFRNEEMCIEAVKTHPLALTHIKPEERTEKVCLEAVKKDGSMLFYVPKQTREIYLAAIAQNPKAIKCVKKEKDY